tara:strand:+ start:1094 stop:1576 length:483 start_codon:yes stop_codon:yes gene_type:complete
LDNFVTIDLAKFLRMQEKDGRFYSYQTFAMLLAIENFAGKNDFGIDVYREWIISRKKRNPDTAVSDFHQLVLSFDKFGFLPSFPIEYDDYDGLMTGGTHRLACSMFFQIDNIPVIVKARSDERRKNPKFYGIEYFKNLGLDDKYISAMTTKKEEVFQKIK